MISYIFFTTWLQNHQETSGFISIWGCEFNTLQKSFYQGFIWFFEHAQKASQEPSKRIAFSFFLLRFRGSVIGILHKRQVL